MEILGRFGDSLCVGIRTHAQEKTLSTGKTLEAFPWDAAPTYLVMAPMGGPLNSSAGDGDFTLLVSHCLVSHSPTRCASVSHLST